MEERDETQSGLRFRLFGTFEARLDGRLLTSLRKRKADRLLAYLILHHPHRVERKQLAAMFWDASIITDPEANLRQSLSFLRLELEGHDGCLITPVGAVGIALSEAQADLLTFLAACERGDATSVALARQIAEEPLLGGWTDEWIAPFRERLTRKLQRAEAKLQTGAPSNAASRDSKLSPTPVPAATRAEAAGGMVPLDSPFYVERTADRDFYAAIRQGESIVLLKGPRQVGKSSLLVRGMEFARRNGRVVYHTDLEQFAPEDLASRDAFYLGLVALLAEQSDLEFQPDADWKPSLNANANLERFLRRRLLASTDLPLLWVLDSIDRLFRTTYFEEFFAFLRSLHSRRATAPNDGWGRISVALASATEAHLYIRDLNQSPFNVGVRIDMEDFTLEQCHELQHRHGLPASHEAPWSSLCQLLGGHPYLLARGLQEIRGGIPPDAFLTLALQPTGPFRDHLESILRCLLADETLANDLRAILEHRVCSDTGFFRLRTAGVVSGTSPDQAQPRCGLYALYFGRHLK